MAQKKAQVTLFLILVAIIIIGAIVILSTRNNVQTAIETPAAKETSAIAQRCLEDITEETAVLIGQQGGFVFTLNDNINEDNQTIGSFSHKGRISAPTIKQLETDYSKAIDTTIPGCIKAKHDNSTFRGSKLEIGSPKTTTTITDDKIIVKTNWIIKTITVGQTEQTSDFTYTSDVRVGLMRSIGSSISADRETHPGYWDFTYLSKLPVQVEFRPYDQRYTIFTLYDSNSHSKIESPYRFNVAIDSPANKAPVLNAPDEIKAKVDETTRGTVRAIDPEGDPVTISAPNPLFDLLPDGTFEFTAQEEGKYDVIVTATDDKGARATKTISVEVAS